MTLQIWKFITQRFVDLSNLPPALKMIFWYNGENDFLEKVRDNEPIIKRNE